MSDDHGLGKTLAYMSSFIPSDDLAVEVRCRSVEDLRIALGIIAAPPDESSSTAYIPTYIPSRVFDIPVIEDPEIQPGEVRAYNARGRLILHHRPPVNGDTALSDEDQTAMTMNDLVRLAFDENLRYPPSSVRSVWCHSLELFHRHFPPLPDPSPDPLPLRFAGLPLLLDDTLPTDVVELRDANGVTIRRVHVGWPA